jgi:transcriptional regulator with GAF, ATPase, and Fis domain
MAEFRWIKLALCGLAAGCIVYCLVALSFIATTPDVGLRCLIAEQGEQERRDGVVTVVSALEPTDPQRNWVKRGDRLIEVAGFRTRTFVDFAWALMWLRDPPKEAIGVLNPGTNPDTEVEDESTLPLQDSRELGRLVKVLYVDAQTGEHKRCWLPLQRQPLGGLILSLVWFILHAAIFALSGLAFWQRPYDRPVRVYFALCMVTAVAYVGGNHWWVLAGSLWFMIPFAVSGMLLPAVLLHFFLVYPSPKGVLRKWPRSLLTAVYGVPALFAMLTTVLMVSASWLSQPAAEMHGAVAADLMPGLRHVVYLYLGVAAAYFGLSIIALIDSFRSTRNPLERGQVKWILWASLVATLPVAYTLMLADRDPVGFAFGDARAPMLLASLLFTSAYAVGIARYKLLLIDQVVSRGMLYYVASFGLTLVFALFIAVAGVAAWREATSTYGYAVPVIVLVALAIIALAWLRDRTQRAIDRWFFREKYALDRALQRMNRAVSSLLERGDVADNMLYSCCEVLRVAEAALYLRDGASPRFRLAAAVGTSALPLQFEADDDLLSQIDQGVSLQRVPSGTSPSQLTLRHLGAELIHGLEVDGETTGVVALGAKPNAAAYTAEDVTFLTAVGRITSVALHCAKVHEDMSRLNEELQHKAEKINEQSRQIAVLQNELSTSDQRGGSAPPATEFRRGPIRGHSSAILHVLDTVRKVAPSDASVLIRGESGTGKELLARALHDNSPRREGPLVAVHCAALAPSLLESELFGHVRGAFTDARDDKIGRFALASGGTLFLDEIGEISLEIQIKLLRVLQERTFEPVGSTKPVQVDVRMIAATHRNLEELIADGTFREDLYYRLNVVSLTLPALRERGDDIFELALYFLRRAAERTGKRITQFDEAAIAALMRYHWPGNIRELENAIERAVVLAEKDRITLDDLPAALLDQTVPSRAREPHTRSAIVMPHTVAARTRAVSPAVLVAGSDDEREMLVQALVQCRGNKTEAARLLNMPRSTYFSKLKKFGVR